MTRKGLGMLCGAGGCLVKERLRASSQVTGSIASTHRGRSSEWLMPHSGSQSALFPKGKWNKASQGSGELSCNDLPSVWDFNRSP